MTCGFAHDAGSYVLGALDPAEQAAFEQHLPGCEQCTRDVREFADLPDLLATVPAEAFEPAAEGDPPVPDTLLPAVLAEMARTGPRGPEPVPTSTPGPQRQQHRPVRTVLLAVAAAVLLIAGTVGVMTAVRDDEPPTAEPTPTISTAPSAEMEALGRGWVTGWVSLTETAWGTRIDLTCTYRANGSGTWPSYTFVVRTSDGEVEQAGTWRAEPGAEMHVGMATAATPDEITSVEVLTEDGSSVLRLRGPFPQ